MTTPQTVVVGTPEPVTIVVGTTGPQGPKGDKGDTGVLAVVQLSQADYDALPVKQPNTIYVIF